MRHMIEALDPRVAAIETARGGPAEVQRLANLHRFLPYYRTYARKAVTKVSQRAIGRALLLRDPAPDPLRANARAAVVAGLDDGQPLRARAMRLRPLFRPSALDDLLSRAGDPTLSEAELLGRVLTAELALRMADASLDE